MINRVSAILHCIGVCTYFFARKIRPLKPAKMFAFSLVEILVALIIVSVIMAALAPVITKKLKSAGITIVGGGSGGAEPKREIDCKGSNFIQIGDLCVTKRNMGDNGNTTLSIPLAASVASVSAGASCNATTGKCCWVGNTAGACDEANGGYSGCNRTVCNYEAAKAICESFTYGGKTWRLPTRAELAQFGAHSIGKGSDGLMMCDNNAGTSSAQCQAGSYKCPGAYLNNCFPYSLWSSEKTSTNAYVYELLTANQWLGHDNELHGAIGVRCVVDNPWVGGTTTVTPSTPSTPAPDCSDGTGLGCPSGYEVDGDVCRVKLEYDFTGDTYENTTTTQQKIYLTSYGTFTAKSAASAEIFLLGGGGGGANNQADNANSGGGGGGMHKIATHSFKKDEVFRVIIGPGGTSNSAGGTTYFGSMTAAGGKGASGNKGGTGSIDGPTGDGGNAAVVGNDGIEYDGEWFAGGGGGGGGYAGGKGGGAKGVGDSPGIAGAANTGGGGGGVGDIDQPGGTGGTGVVIIRINRTATTPLICTKPAIESDVCSSGQVKGCPDGYILDGNRCTTKLLYNFTGSSHEGERDTSIKQKIYLTSNGVFTAQSSGRATLFLVGGGGGGANNQNDNAESGGGGGGYTTLDEDFVFKKGDQFRVVIGVGGGSNSAGKTTYFGQKTANGGKGGSGYAGGVGTGNGGNANSYGSDGIAFDGEFFGGGGGGGHPGTGTTIGGHGGGAPGVGDVPGIAGTPNTGGGGGGVGDIDQPGGTGGSGVVIIKIDRERILPTCITPTPEFVKPENTEPVCDSGYKMFNGVCTTDFKYTHTGDSLPNETDDKLKIYLKSSGTFYAESAGTATVFLVGGGGGGANNQADDSNSGGGGGGLTQIANNFQFKKGDKFRVIIGSGGTSNSAGGATYFGSLTADGGRGGSAAYGGSGTGFGGNAGASGGDGIEFDNEWFGGGGAGGCRSCTSVGGLGGGAPGVGDSPGIAGTPNTGGGGGGVGDIDQSAGKGGSGVVVIKIDKTTTPPLYLTHEEKLAKEEEDKSKIIYNTCLSGFSFDYTGSYNVKQTDYDYKIYLKSTGYFTPYNKANAKIFLVGGGGGGANNQPDNTNSGGGGGGFVNLADFTMEKNASYYVEIGAGGTCNNKGKTTTFGSLNAEGGFPAKGAYGGSGGVDGLGGDGGNAAQLGNDGVEFEGDWFSGGGGGGGGALGGLGGGAKGVGDVGGISGDPNTGGGGGGVGDIDQTAGAGGSGIVVISLKDCPDGDSGSGIMSGGVGLTTACSNVINGNCRLCSRSAGQCFSCSLSCPDGYYKDTQTCTCLDCKEKFGENCFKCNDSQCLKSNAFGEPRNQADCDPFNAIFIDKKYNGTYGKNVCVTRYNVGDSGGPPIHHPFALSKTVFDIGTTCTHGTKSYCCWRGKTADSACTHNNIGYDSCYRTVCGYHAALESCAWWTPYGSMHYNWSLPEQELVNGWISSYSANQELKDIFNDAYKLAFCTQNDYSPVKRCKINTTSCPGADNGGYCIPSRMWAWNTTVFELSSALAWMNTYNTAATAASARCVSSHVPLR